MDVLGKLEGLFSWQSLKVTPRRINTWLHFNKKASNLLAFSSIRR